MPIRKNIATSAVERQKYVQGVLALKAQFTAGVTTTSLGIGGQSRPVSTWDRFVHWHHTAMGFAHQGPLFLPWHRMMLRTMEQLLQQVLGDPNFGLPYWDWAADGDLPAAQRLTAPIWASDCMGKDLPTSGPFTLSVFPIRLATTSGGSFVQVNRALQRTRGFGVPGILNPPLPTKSETAAAIQPQLPDTNPWNKNSTGFRNRLEGWKPGNKNHNLVHIWVGGEMLPSSSPNDPVFYLNHCNVDRIWEKFMVDNGRNYLPLNSTPGAPVGQRKNDPMLSPFGPSITPAQVLNMTAIYTYDSLAV